MSILQQIRESVARSERIAKLAGEIQNRKRKKGHLYPNWRNRNVSSEQNSIRYMALFEYAERLIEIRDEKQLAKTESESAE